MGADRKSAFTHEIDRRLLEGKIDIAVHSMKDVPASIDERLLIAATPPRNDARDALVTVSRQGLQELPPGSAVGTSSVRRKVQLARLRQDIRVVDVRGNVETRIEKMKERSVEGVVLAAAGLQRLGLADRVSQYFAVNEMVPAACQGIIAASARRGDSEVLEVLKRIDDRTTHSQGVCERAFLMRLGGDCSFPVGAYARVVGVEIEVVAMVAAPDGSSVFVESASGRRSDAKNLGVKLAERLLEAKEIAT